MTEHSAFFKLIETVSNLIDPPGKRKVESLLVSDAEWPGVEAWIEKWRDVPWPERRKCDP